MPLPRERQDWPLDDDHTAEAAPGPSLSPFVQRGPLSGCEPAVFVRHYNGHPRRFDEFPTVIQCGSPESHIQTTHDDLVRALARESRAGHSTRLVGALSPWQPDFQNDVLHPIADSGVVPPLLMLRRPRGESVADDWRSVCAHPLQQQHRNLFASTLADFLQHPRAMERLSADRLGQRAVVVSVGVSAARPNPTWQVLNSLKDGGVSNVGLYVFDGSWDIASAGLQSYFGPESAQEPLVDVLHVKLGDFENIPPRSLQRDAGDSRVVTNLRFTAGTSPREMRWASRFLRKGGSHSDVMVMSVPTLRDALSKDSRRAARDFYGSPPMVRFFLNGLLAHLSGYAPPEVLRTLTPDCVYAEAHPRASQVRILLEPSSELKRFFVEQGYPLSYQTLVLRKIPLYPKGGRAGDARVEAVESCLSNVGLTVLDRIDSPADTIDDNRIGSRIYLVGR